MYEFAPMDTGSSFFHNNFLLVNCCDAVIDGDISCPAANNAAGLGCSFVAFARSVNDYVANHVTNVFEVKGHDGMTSFPAFRLVVVDEPPCFHSPNSFPPKPEEALRYPDESFR